MSPDRIVGLYLELCEERRLDEAAEYLAPAAKLVFPGGVTHASLDDMVAGAAGRYRWVRKRRHHVDVADRDDGSTVVIVRGFLHGENLSGVPFDEVRFIDVFVVDNDLIQEQHVWNDLAESGVLETEG